MEEAQDSPTHTPSFLLAWTGASVVRAFEDRVDAHPLATAVQFEAQQLTYAELNRLANGLAQLLLELGVTPGAPVALCLDPGPLTAIAILGVLKAGGAYVPVSSSDPVERIAYVLHDTAASVLLTEERLLPEVRRLAPHPIALDRLLGSLGDLLPGDLLPGDVRDTIAAGRPDTRAGNPDRPYDPAQTAYILYTSGSSGNPKGVMVPHASLSYYLRWHAEHLRPAIGHVDLPLSSSTCFAAGVTQFYTPLLLGRTLHVFRHGAVREPERVFAWYRTHPAYGLYCVPTLWNELVKFAERRRDEGQPIVGPRCVLLSGEAVDRTLVDRSVAVWPDIRLWNLYGPTEATANATAGELRPGAPVTIGAPLAGTRIYLADTLADGTMTEAAQGEAGELCICGDGVAAGYVNLPDLTRQRFVSNPFDRTDSRRLFKTGDLARYTELGDLVFLGRRDFQVKIRGYRIECGEIEQALLQYPAIRQAIVICRERGDGEKMLVAYLTFHFARYASVDEVRTFLASRLPEYMMPAAFVMLETLPMLANGKVDRKRLPAPGAVRPALAYAFVPPRTIREKQLVRIWEAALGVEGVGAEDNFFDLGGDSLKVAAALAQIGDALHVAVSYRDLFDHPTPAGLAAFLSASSEEAAPEPARPETSVPPPEPIAAMPARTAYPCADNQHSLWMLAQTYPDLSAYNIRFSLRLEGALDRDALARSVHDIVRRHEALRTVFRLDGDGPVSTVRPFGDVAIPVVDVGHLDPSQRDAAVEQLAAAEGLRPFALETGPLFRCTLYRLADDRHRLSVVVHHIVFDGRSIGVFCRDFTEGYRRARAAQQAPASTLASTPASTPAAPLQYQDWVIWQRRQLAAQGDEVAERWKAQLEGSAFVLDFPTDYARPARRSFKGGCKKVRLGEAVKQRLGRFNQREQTTTFMTLLAVFNVLLYRYSGQEDILVGSPVANRRHAGLEDLIGFFTNTIVVRTRLAKEQTFRTLLAAVRDTCLEAFDRQSLPFEKLVHVLRPDRRLSHTPVFQVMFACHEALFHGRVDDRLIAEAYEDGTSGAKFDLALDVQDREDGLELRLTYSTDLYADSTIERCLDHYVRLLDLIVRDPDQPIAEYRLMSDADLDTIRRWNAPAAARPAVHDGIVDDADDAIRRDPIRQGPIPEEGSIPEETPIPEKTLHELFEAQARRTPHRTALIAGAERLTYDELDGRATRLARSLVAGGVEPGARVGVHVEPCADMIVALLAVLKAGAAYVPLDPYYPRERIAYIIEDSGACLILTHQHLRARLGECPTTVLAIDAPGALLLDAALGVPGDTSLSEQTRRPDGTSAAEQKSLHEQKREAGELMYVMYTSGSTGRPKGVMVPHRGAANYVCWMQRHFPLSADDRVLGKTSINFDISVWEIFLPLISGAQLVVAGRDELQAADSLAALIQRAQITQIQFVPSALRAFVDSGRLAACTSLARIISGGEALPVKLQADVFDAFAGELHNLYGPTEASIYACHWVCRRDERRRSVPIGRPISHLRVYILDAQLQPVPIGMPGDLYIGGAGVARGYWNKPELTATAFIPDPWSDPGSPDPEARLFKTGDVARYWSDGVLEFLGRSDRQVKVRGYRIELDEIEHHLASHPQVKHAIIIVREDQADDVRLVAYLLYRDKHGPTTSELREYLKQKLPDYMVPSTFVPLDSVPLLPNDKANVKALPKPEYTKSLDADLTRRYDTDCERQLAAIWEDVLGTEKFGPEDSFFDVGGHSLLMAKLGLLIEERLRVEISNIDLFQFPTIRSLARHITGTGKPASRVVTEMARRAALGRQRPRTSTGPNARGTPHPNPLPAREARESPPSPLRGERAG